MILSREKESLILKSGEFVYYPTYHAHTIESISDDPANYLMFRWSNKLKKRPDMLNFSRFKMFPDTQHFNSQNDFSSTMLFEGPTGSLEKLHCHISNLKPGGGYAPHEDKYDVAIIVLEGEIETIGKRAKPYDVIFYPHGEDHGMYNPGDKTAQYIVFEFHRKTHRLKKKTTNFIKKVTSPANWKRKIKKLINSRVKI